MDPSTNSTVEQGWPSFSLKVTKLHQWTKMQSDTKDQRSKYGGKCGNLIFILRHKSRTEDYKVKKNFFFHLQRIPSFLNWLTSCTNSGQCRIPDCYIFFIIWAQWPVYRAFMTFFSMISIFARNICRTRSNLDGKQTLAHRSQLKAAQLLEPFPSYG